MVVNFNIFPLYKNDLIINAIKENSSYYKDKEIRYKLIYKTIFDGEQCSKHHKKCNYIPNTLNIIKTNNKRHLNFLDV